MKNSHTQSGRSPTTMQPKSSSLLLMLYSLLLPHVAPLILQWRLMKGKEDPARINERRGHTGHPRPEGSLIWIHATSVGEVRSVLPLVERLTQQGYSLLLTSTTRTSAQLAAKILPPGAFHHFVPL